MVRVTGYVQEEECASRDVLEDPGHELRDARADAWEVGLRAADAPGNDAGKEVAAVLSAHLQRPAAVALARVAAAAFVARAQEDLRDELVPAGAQEHVLAPVVADDRDAHLLQHRRQRPLLAEPAPTGDGRVLSDQQVVRRREADRRDVRRELELPVEPHERQVVFVREEVVLRVHELLRDAALHVRQLLGHATEVVLAHPDPYLRCQQAEKQKRAQLSTRRPRSLSLSTVTSHCRFFSRRAFGA